MYRATKKSAKAKSAIFRIPLTAEKAIITASPMFTTRKVGLMRWGYGLHKHKTIRPPDETAVRPEPGYLFLGGHLHYAVRHWWLPDQRCTTTTWCSPQGKQTGATGMPGFEQLRGSGAPTSHRVSRLLMQLVPLVPAADLAERQREKQEKQKANV